jgi:Sulfotransferase family
MSADRVKVLYNAGNGRSGTTILSNILGEYEGCFSAREVRSVWSELSDRPVDSGSWRCGRGAAVRHCPVWKLVFECAFGRLDRIDSDRVRKLRRSIDRSRYASIMAMKRWRRIMARRIDAYADAVGRIYRAISEVMRCCVIVDGSKGPLFALVMGAIEDFDVYIAHMIRYPRACAFSLRRAVQRPDTVEQAYMLQQGALRSELAWGSAAVASSTIAHDFPGRFTSVRYEDVVTQPRQTIKDILDLFGEAPGASPFVSDNEIELRPNDTIWGNPNRMRAGRSTLRADEEWKS